LLAAGAAIRALRGTSVTQKQFAERLGVSQATLSGWESATKPIPPPADKLLQLGNLAMEVGDTGQAIAFWRLAGVSLDALNSYRRYFTGSGIRFRKYSSPSKWEELPEPELRIGSRFLAGSSPALFALFVPDDSMWPTLRRGDAVVVDESPFALGKQAPHSMIAAISGRKFQISYLWASKRERGAVGAVRFVTERLRWTLHRYPYEEIDFCVARVNEFDGVGMAGFGEFREAQVALPCETATKRTKVYILGRVIASVSIRNDSQARSEE
jgi:transcriptional regulator with XRE-family HTH domain